MANKRKGKKEEKRICTIEGCGKELVWNEEHFDWLCPDHPVGQCTTKDEKGR
jgi:hypothetical protein